MAETVKAVSAQHGGIIHAHRSIWMVVRELARAAGDARDAETQQWLNSSFLVARSLYSNYYEDEAEEEDVRAGLRQCELLSERLYTLFRPDGLGDDGG